MFERFTEKARRAVFYARAEASEVGSPWIETEHLLLGILRQSAVVPKLLGEAEKIRGEILAERPPRPRISEKVDLPVSSDCKAAFVYAAEEAETQSSQSITPRHLLLGLLRVPESLAARLVVQRGITLEDVRAAVAEMVQRPVNLQFEPQGEASCPSCGNAVVCNDLQVVRGMAVLRIECPECGMRRCWSVRMAR